MTTKMTFQPRTVGLLVTVLLAAGLSSCRDKEPPHPEIKVVSAKDTKLESGSTVWVIAFTDGTSARVDFGAYTMYSVGDTACWVRSEYGFGTFFEPCR